MTKHVVNAQVSDIQLSIFYLFMLHFFYAAVRRNAIGSVGGDLTDEGAQYLFCLLDQCYLVLAYESHRHGVTMSYFANPCLLFRCQFQ